MDGAVSDTRNSPELLGCMPITSILSIALPSSNRHSPRALDQLPRIAQEIEYPDDRRSALVAALLAQNGPSANLDRIGPIGERCSRYRSASGVILRSFLHDLQSADGCAGSA